ncbi:hypothetical protein ACFLWG_03405 [Chloroflexota bacterium]
MIQIPVWLWVVSVLGVIAAGIGLGYLIIFLFWRIEKYFYPRPVVRSDIQAEMKVEEPLEQPEPEEEPVLEKESIEVVDEEVKKEMASIMVAPISGEKNSLIKFTTILQSKFNHPFHKANTIVCWDIALKNGDEVQDTEGKVMKLQVIKPPNESEHARCILVDESGHKKISIIPAKEYIKRETTLDFDKVKINQ